MRQPRIALLVHERKFITGWKYWQAIKLRGWWDLSRAVMRRPFVAGRSAMRRLVQNRVSAPEDGRGPGARPSSAAGACERCGRLKSSGARWSGARWSGARWSGARWSGARWSGHSLRRVRLGGGWFRIASQRPRRARTGVWVRTLCPRRQSRAAVRASGWRSPPKTTAGCCR